MISSSLDLCSPPKLTIEVFGCDDQRGEEDTVASAVHALGDFGQARL